MRAAEIQPAAGARAWAHHRRIAARLAGLPGVAPPAIGPPVRAPASREDRSLAHVLAQGPMPIPDLVELAAQVARTIGAMHRRGVLHLALQPAHIVLGGAGRPPILTGLERATTFAEERPGFTHHSEIQGDLAYLSPEQTGRTGRSVDLRSDLYALGACLHAAATGRPPFESQDPLQLLHDHLVSVPAAPKQLRPELPDALSRIIVRLLEKEPERRYQSADGLAHDLEAVQASLADGGEGPLALGERDFPLKLSAPSRLVGRGAEIGQLRQALDDAIHAHGRAVLVSGAPGVGKTSLINELRPMVTARRGWFVSGKFDQYRQDAPTATVQALRALGRLLLAQPEDELAQDRERILLALGANAALVCEMPEFALLLGPRPEVPAAEASQAESRLLATLVNLLRAIASAERPIVLVMDDLQWAGAVSVRFIDAVLHMQDLPGLLLVGSFRDTEVDAAHPVGAALARWHRLGRAVLQMRLANLPDEDLREMLHRMMRMPHSQAAALAIPVGEHTGGNPYDTVELLNALRREGALRPGPQGWEWDAAPLRRYVSASGVVDLLAARILRMPDASRHVIRVMACLGGQVKASLLAAASGLDAAGLDEHLAAPLEEGLLVVEPGEDGALRLRHDRVQQAAYATLTPADRAALHLGLARRLGSLGFDAAAVEQYVPAEPAIADDAEIRHVASLLGDTARRVKGAANFAVAERLAAAALRLMDRLAEPDAADEARRAALEVEHHGSLCSLGRLDDADVLYRAIVARGGPLEDWVDAACAQVVSLHNRSRPREAVALGVPLLHELGHEPPEDFETADLESRLRDFAEWARGVEIGVDQRPYTGDARATAAAKLINRLAYPSYFSNIRVMAWLIVEGLELWKRHGPSPDLVHALAHSGGITIGINQDYRAAWDGIRHVVGVSDSRGWELSSAEAKFLLAGHARQWFEPLEHLVRHLYVAREALQRNGQLHAVSYTYRSTTTAMLDCAPTLAAWGDELRAALALVLRLHSEYLVALMANDLHVLNALAGEETRVVLPGEALVCLERQAPEPPMALSIHFRHALLAALWGDVDALVRETGLAMRFVRHTSNYRAAQVRALHALGLAHTIRTASLEEAGPMRAELDAMIAWMGERAQDAPANFLHLVKWMEAERAWALGAFTAAARGFDEALVLLDAVVRPCHHGLVAERHGVFLLEQGMVRAGRQAIAQARQVFAQWGAARKVAQLERAHPFLVHAQPQAGAPGAGDAGDALDTLDTLAILRASQALSSETSVARLEDRVAVLMRSLTGATTAQLALWDAERKDWFVPAGPDAPGERVPLGAPGARGLLPLSAFRYVERTREALLVEDAAADDRFAGDPYLLGRGACSLLIVPILAKGLVRAMLVLENHQSRGAFRASRLDAVRLIAGQLSVSIENALLYDGLERRVAEQTRELVAAARRAGMAQIATNVLHNVGNVLNSVNVSARSLGAAFEASRLPRVGDLAGLLERQAGRLGEFFAGDGSRVPGYLRELADALDAERREQVRELERLVASVDHIKNVVGVQLSYAGPSGSVEAGILTDLLEEALRMKAEALEHAGVTVERDYGALAPAAFDKPRVMQILLNVIDNAGQAMREVDGVRRLHVAARQGEGTASVVLRDTGCGIAPEHLGLMFSHGFTTKPDGHGFGLHSCAIAAREMGGELTVHSEGAGRGATFTLRLPA